MNAELIQNEHAPIDASLNVDMVNHPPHYNGHPKNIECIDVIEDAPFMNLGQALKYIWRVTWGNRRSITKDIEDIEKAIWYLNRHINNIKKAVNQ